MPTIKLKRNAYAEDQLFLAGVVLWPEGVKTPSDSIPKSKFSNRDKAIAASLEAAAALDLDDEEDVDAMTGDGLSAGLKRVGSLKEMAQLDKKTQLEKRE